MIKKSCYRGWHATSNSPAAAELPVPPCPAGAHYALCTRYVEICSSTPAEDVLVALHCCSRRLLENLSFLTMFTVQYVQETSFWTWTLKDNCSNALPMWFTHNACAVHCMSTANSQQQLYNSSLYNASDFSRLCHVTLVSWSTGGWQGQKLYVFTSRSTEVVSAKSSRHSQPDKPDQPTQSNMASKLVSYRKCFSDRFDRK